MSSISESLNNLLSVDGAMGACIVDYTSGLVLGEQGGGVDLQLAGAGNSEVIKSKMQTMERLGIEGKIEDMLITLEGQFHIIRPTVKHKGLFIYLVLDKKKSNLALARHKVSAVEEQLVI